MVDSHRFNLKLDTLRDSKWTPPETLFQICSEHFLDSHRHPFGKPLLISSYLIVFRRWVRECLVLHSISHPDPRKLFCDPWAHAGYVSFSPQKRFWTELFSNWELSSMDLFMQISHRIAWHRHAWYLMKFTFDSSSGHRQNSDNVIGRKSDFDIFFTPRGHRPRSDRSSTKIISESYS